MKTTHRRAKMINVLGKYDFMVIERDRTPEDEYPPTLENLLAAVRYALDLAQDITGGAVSPLDAYDFLIDVTQILPLDDKLCSIAEYIHDLYEV